MSYAYEALLLTARRAGLVFLSTKQTPDQNWMEEAVTEESLEYQLTKAQIEKTLAEARKLDREAAAAERQSRGAAWSAPLKTLGGAILGLGGIIAAWTQYEVAELKARAANLELQAAEKGRKEAQEAAGKALSELRTSESRARQAQQEAALAEAGKKDALARRASALDERKKIEAEIAKLQTTLAQTARDLQASEQETRKARGDLQTQVLLGLKPEAALLATRLLEKAKSVGIRLRLVAGYRSAAEQAELKEKRQVSSLFSSHMTGLAFDVVVIKDGQSVFDRESYAPVGALGKELGLVWGGNFNIPDLMHFETLGARDELNRVRSAASASPSP